MLLPLLVKKEGNRLSFWGFHLWAHCFRAFTGIWYEVKGLEHLSSRESYIIIPNHTSFLDICLLPLITKGAFKTLSKKEVGKIPIFGPFARLVTVMVDRSNAKSRLQSVIKMKKALQGGTSLVIFPEGTVNKTRQLLNPFYDGAFRIALETGASLVPVAIAGAGRLMPPKGLLMRPGTIRVQILAPVPVSSLGVANLPELKAGVYSSMEAQLQEMYAGLQPQPLQVQA
ncbi:lysophospholipid acyltransferase family protein [Cesiribacter andamanensis]|nr:lysophospholipid acyltransferase family protein [Cesiribacter andamanensis]